MKETFVCGLTLPFVVPSVEFSSMTTISGIGRRKTNGFAHLCAVVDGRDQ